MRIKLTSILVDNQEKARGFYTETLGFTVKHDFPVDDAGNRWLTVVSPDDPDGIELLLEPNQNPAADVFQKAMFEQGIPYAAFVVSDIHAEHKRLAEAGVIFFQEPKEAWGVIAAVIEDTCGNLIQLYQTL